MKKNYFGLTPWHKRSCQQRYILLFEIEKTLLVFLYCFFSLGHAFASGISLMWFVCLTLAFLGPGTISLVLDCWLLRRKVELSVDLLQFGNFCATTGAQLALLAVIFKVYGWLSAIALMPVCLGFLAFDLCSCYELWQKFKSTYTD